MGTGKIVYEGIHEVINGKAIFMRQSMQYDKVYKLIEERLKDKSFQEKMSRCGEEMEDGSYVLWKLTDAALEWLFDELFSKKISRCLKEMENPAYRMYALPMSMNGVEKTVDITGFVIYGIICNKRCRQMLWAEMPEGDDYYSYYEQSRYRSWALEECLKAEEIWDARLIIGLLEKMRWEEENGFAYRLLMKIIYAGYWGLRKWLEEKTVVTGSEIKAQVFIAHSEEYSMLYCICEIVLAIIIAQDSGVEVCFDYEMLLLLHFMERSEAEMREGNSCAQDVRKDEEVKKAEYGKFLKRFRKEYGTDSSLEALIFRSETKRIDKLLIGVMAQYHISPRMFCGMDLMEEEKQALLGLSDKWTMKSYWSMLVIAHLCKYIGELKENYLMHMVESARIHSAL